MKRKKWQIIFFAVLCLIIISAVGCKKNNNNSPYKIYYVNAQGTTLTESAYTGTVESTEEILENMLRTLSEQKDVELQPALPEGVQIDRYELEHGKVKLYFNSQYLEMSTVREILARAAVVRTLTQIASVNEVMFYVEEKPLTNSDGNPYGYMRAADFVQNTGSSINYFEVAEFQLYFSDDSGKRLVKETQRVRYNYSQMKESATVECLIKGPKSEDAIVTLPPETKLLNASVKEGICYLNFNEGLLNTVKGVKPETIIYSIVNSVIDCGNVGMVQIAINGESNILYQESIELGRPLSRNLDIVEDE